MMSTVENMNEADSHILKRQTIDICESLQNNEIGKKLLVRQCSFKPAAKGFYFMTNNNCKSGRHEQNIWWRPHH